MGAVRRMRTCIRLLAQRESNRPARLKLVLSDSLLYPIQST